MISAGWDMKKAMLLLGAIAVLLSPVTVAAQTLSSAVSSAAAEVWELVLKDGSRIFGTVESQTDQDVVLRTHAGAIVTAKREEIASLRPVRGRIENGEFLRSDAHRTRLFFAPTGRSLKKGEVSLGVFEFYAPFVQVGVTDRVSIGGGTPLMFGFGEWDRPFWVTPKVQVLNTPDAQAAVGLLHVFIYGRDAGIAYGVGTFGNTDNAVSGGAGMMYSGDNRGWIVMGGGERRVHRFMKIMTENYVWEGGEGIISGGVRFLGERLSADLALAAPLGIGDFYVAPVVNFAYVF